jgi:glycosyltransferase involved in cell wall biosynthesis
MSEIPFPPDNGIRADIWGRLRAMHRLGYRIDALIMESKTRPEDRHVAEVRGLVNSVRFVERRPLRSCLATVAPTDVARNTALATVPLFEAYDVTIAEADSMLPIFTNPQLQTRKRVLRAHNNESAYYWAAAKTEESFLGKQFCRLEALRYFPFSRAAYSWLDSLWFISQSEYQRFRAAQPAMAAKAVWVPPSIERGNEAKQIASNCHNILFVASFHISLNREALRWYLREVHPILERYPRYDLVIAGSTRGGGTRAHLAAQMFAEDIQRERRHSVYWDIQDLTSLYRESAVFINPAQRGAGVKMKNIHAIERRVPVVTTSVGNEGSGFRDKEHVLIADTPASFASAIRYLLDNPAVGQGMAERAYSYLNTHYDTDANIHRLVTNLVSQSFGPGEARHPALVA